MPAPSTIEELGLATIGKVKSMPAHEVGAKQAGTTVGRKEATKGATQEEPKSAEPNLEEAKSQELSPPFIIGEGVPAVPAKLVSKIKRGEYVDMAELLKDNIEMERHHGTSGSGSLCSAVSKPQCREVPVLLSWVQCYGTYACVLGTKFPHLTKKL